MRKLRTMEKVSIEEGTTIDVVCNGGSCSGWWLVALNVSTSLLRLVKLHFT